MSYWTRIQTSLNKEFVDDDEILENSNVEETKTDQVSESPKKKQKNNLNLKYNFNVKESSKKRKLSNLFGYIEKVKKDEIENEEQTLDDKPDTEIETWEHTRETSRNFAERDRRVAFKRDELAEYDDEGYRYSPEQPTFRDGFNNTLRIKTPDNPDLNNGVEMNISGREIKPIEKSALVTMKPREKAVQKVEVLDPLYKPEMTQEEKMLNPLSKTLRMNKHDLEKVSHLKVWGESGNYIPANKRNLRKSLLKRDTIHSKLGYFVLKALYEGNAGINPEQRKSLLHSMKQGQVFLEKVGKIFVELGFVLPPEIHEKSKRHEFDSKAMELGLKLMTTDMNGKSSEAPLVEESTREDLALALGRTMENLRALECKDGASALRILTPDVEKTRRKNQVRKGVTFFILEKLGVRSEQLGSKSYFRNEQQLKEEGQAESILELNSKENGFKSVWDGFAKDEHINERSLLPSRPNYL